jgi:hypothetical protein
MHHPPKTVEQQSEDSFPASDPPTYSGGSVGAPVDRKSASHGADKQKKDKPKKD